LRRAGFLLVLVAIIVRVLLQRNPSLTFAGASPQRLRDAVDWFFYIGLTLCCIWLVTNGFGNLPGSLERQ
jgi:hypothetical protein